MAKCGRGKKCNKPRARWWKKSLSVDWFDHNTADSEPEEPVDLYDDVVGVNTTADGKQVYWVTGADSNWDGRSASIPVVGANTLYNFDKTLHTWSEITTQSVSNDDNTKGSIWQQFATDRKAASGYITYLVQCARGGSDIGPASDDIDWSDTGDLWAPSLADVQAALADLGLQYPRAIFMNAIINDIRDAGKSSQDCKDGLLAFVTKVTTAFPGVPILFPQIGRTEGSSLTQKLYDLRVYAKQLSELFPDFHIVGSGPAMIGAGYYNGDDLHYSTDGNNAFGAMHARWFANYGIYSKWANSVISSHFDDLSSGRKTEIATDVDWVYDNGMYLTCEGWFNFKTTIQNNVYLDFGLISYTAFSGATFSANSHVAASGSPNFITIGIIPSFCTLTSQNDFICLSRLKTRTTGAGTTAVLFGTSDGVAAMLVGQIAASTTGRCNDNTVTAGTEASLTSGNTYGVARSDANTKLIIKNTAIDTQAAVASTGRSNTLMRLFCFNNNGSNANFLNGQAEDFAKFKYSTYNSGYITIMTNLRTNW